MEEGRVDGTTFQMVRKEDKLLCRKRPRKKKEVKVVSRDFRTLLGDRLGLMGIGEEPYGFVVQNRWREQEQSGNEQRCEEW